MQEISSVNNEKIKEIIKLKQKKHRETCGLVLIEGYKIFLEAEKTDMQILDIFVTKKEFEKLNLKKYENIITIIGDNISQKLSYNQTSQNFFAIIRPKKTHIESAKFLILDTIQDPQNLGAIIRTSVACGIKKLYLINSVDEFNDKVIRASMGNVFKTDCENITKNDLSKICKNKQIFCADMDGENLFSFKQKPNEFGLILGNEGSGVSEDVKKFATKTLSIPMQNDVESLNVAVSCAIVLYHLTY